MLFVECLQGSPAWMDARAGVTTASCFSDAISKTGGLNDQQKMYCAAIAHGHDSKSAALLAGYKSAPTSEGIKKYIETGIDPATPSDVSNRYASDLAFERISGKPYGIPPKTWLLDRGHELEADARIAYEARTGFLVEEVGFVMTDDHKFGYSTDGQPEDGLIEIKCPIDTQKILAMWETGDVSEYIHQMQGGLWITNRKWCDFLMYAPALKSVGKDLFVKRIMRDDNFIDSMVSDLLAFDRRVEAYIKFLKEAA